MSTTVCIEPHEVAAMRELAASVNAMAIVIFNPSDVKRAQLQASARIVDELVTRIEKAHEA